MTGALPTHATWLFVTACTFVIGTQLARTSLSGDVRSTARGAAASGETGVPLPGMLEERVSGAATDPGTTAKSHDRSAPTENRTQRAPAVKLPRLLKSSPSSRPLRQEEIQALVRAAIKSPDPVVRRQAFDRLLREMRSPVFTLEQALQIRTTMRQEGATGEEWALFDYAWGANSPADAVAHLDEITDPHRQRYLGNMIPGLASVDPQAAIDLFSSLEPKLQVKIRSRLFEGLVDNDLEVATEYIYDLAANGDHHDWRPMDQLAKEVFKEVGLDAMQEWVDGLPQGPPRGSAVSSVFGHWGGSDPHAAVAQIMDMPPSTDRDFALNGFTASLAHKDGGTAVLWAAEIGKPGLRDIAVVRAANTWGADNPAAMLSWLPSSSLSPQAQLKLRNAFSTQTTANTDP